MQPQKIKLRGEVPVRNPGEVAKSRCPAPQGLEMQRVPCPSEIATCSPQRGDLASRLRPRLWTVTLGLALLGCSCTPCVPAVLQVRAGWRVHPPGLWGPGGGPSVVVVPAHPDRVARGALVPTVSDRRRGVLDQSPMNRLLETTRMDPCGVPLPMS
jgi:hypothetical protein